MLEVETALEKILKEVRVMDTRVVPLLSAADKVIAEDIEARDTIPPFSKSAMDGYAVRAEDTEITEENSEPELTVKGEIAAGHRYKGELKPGEALRIMTGAPVPEDADAVLRQEYVERIGDKIIVKKEIETGRDICPRGEDVKAGQQIFTRGTKATPAVIGMLATLGYSEVKIYRSPEVAIMSTGDELLEIEKELEAGKIRNSNSYSLAAQVKLYGAEPKLLGIGRDDIAELKEKFKKGLKADILITTGGVSVGDYDLIKDIYEELGIDILFWKVAMKPGKPVLFGTHNQTLVFGLPGNPSAAMVSFENFVRPAILKMKGETDYRLRSVTATLTEDIKKKKGRRYYLRGVLSEENGEYKVHRAGPQGSGIIFTFAAANSLMVLPADGDFFSAGSEVEVLVLDKWF